MPRHNIPSGLSKEKYISAHKLTGSKKKALQIIKLGRLISEIGFTEISETYELRSERNINPYNN